MNICQVCSRSIPIRSIPSDRVIIGHQLCSSCLDRIASMDRPELVKTYLKVTVERDSLAVTVARLRGILGRTHRKNESTLQGFLSV